jgi:glycyl-tRNA synthetase beta chain
LAGVQSLTGPLFKQDHEAKTGPFIELVKELTPLITSESAEPFLRSMVTVTKDMPKLDQPNYDILESVVKNSAQVRDFLLDRMEIICRDEGISADVIRAATIMDGDRGKEDDLVRLLARVHALQSFIDTDNGTNLLAGYKRAANILKKEDWRGIEGEIARTGDEDPLSQVDDPGMKAVVDAKMAERHARELSYTPEEAEKALIEALDAAEPQASAAIEKEDFAAAMSALASLRAPIDAFFEEVTVNDENPDKRAARLDLLARFRAAVHNVADFSEIEG